MTKSLFILIFTCLVVEVFAQTVSSSTRRRQAADDASDVEATTRLRSNFLTTDDCIADECPCCIFLSYDSVASDGETVLDRVITTVCKRDFSTMANVERVWGPAEEMTIGDRVFRVFNSDLNQRNRIRQALEVLPAFYLQAVPANIRIGNPKTGSRNAPSSGRIGGGSRRCFVPSPDYEYIIIHPLAFARGQDTDPRMTILHEVGHFVDREYGISQSLVSAHREQFAQYLSIYRGDSRGNDEVIAQGIMCYYFRKHFRNRVFTTEPEDYVPGRASLFPQWLLDIIEADIASRS